ncbi:MAG: hypothetical protein LIO53_04605, partial [Oscillospiraceae bacterium]|nr:hypothetical protein [Oscillospiraceae bacterium]
MKKKILGALVALSMVCSLLPTIAFAETGFYVETSGGTENYSTLTNAWDKAMAADEATITMYEDATISSQLQVLAGDNITLDLNGHTIDRGLSSSSAVNGGSVIYVMGDTTTNEEGCFTLTDTSSNVISEQGTITGGNNLYSGGGINVCEWGRFTMEGGNITGNKSADNGGGVTVSGDTDYRESYFTMTGGSISGNTASDNGGGIAVFERGFVEIEGGTISGNTATTSGGGVYLYGDDDGNHGTLTMSGDATITGNSANLNGGGVYVTTHSEFIMTGGTIGGDDDSYANTATYGGGVSSDSGTFKMNDGTIIGNAASRQGGGVYVNDEYGYFEMNNGTITKNSSDLGSGIHVEIGYLKMTGGNISGNSARYGGGLDISDSDGYAEITDGNITGNSATDGGGVYVDYGEFKMTGGNISGNSADSLGGG